MKLFRRNRCPHVHIRGIYGDEINAAGGYRLACSDCGRLLDGPVSLATWSVPEAMIEEYRHHLDGGDS